MIENLKIRYIVFELGVIMIINIYLVFILVEIFKPYLFFIGLIVEIVLTVRYLYLLIE